MEQFCIFCGKGHASFDCTGQSESKRLKKGNSLNQDGWEKNGAVEKVRAKTFINMNDWQTTHRSTVLPTRKIPLKIGGEQVYSQPKRVSRATMTVLSSEMILTVDEFETALREGLAELRQQLQRQWEEGQCSDLQKLSDHKGDRVVCSISTTKENKTQG